MGDVPLTNSARVGWRRRAGAYVELTKPRIVEVLLITTVPAMVLAAGGWPGTGLVAVTVAGGALAAGGANALNMYLDRDLDAVMQRTEHRPIPSGRVRPTEALVVGVVLLIAGTALLAVAANGIAAAVTFAAGVFYVVVYTGWLKRRSPQNIVIGGAAGAVPPVAGWAAVRGGIGWEPVLLASVVFLWTPPHFWALALRYREDYQRAAVPMLPVVARLRTTLTQALAYAVATVAVSVALWYVSPLGFAYLLVAVAAGGWFLWSTVALVRRDGRQPMRLFGVSIGYLAIVFTAVAVDQLV